MKLIQLYMKKQGIRFFAKIPKKLNGKLSGESYQYYYKKESFLAELARREDEYDMILITAHGAENSIIIPITQHDPYRQEYPERSDHRYRTYISARETYFFKNDFVFAVSCLTAKELGPEVVKNGVIAYLGYDVIIQNLFDVSDVCMSSRVRNLYTIAVKRIFVEELVLAITHFLEDMQNVLTLKQWFAFHLEKSLINFFQMSADEIYAVYGLKIDDGVWKKNRQKLQVQQLNFLDEINKHLTIVGDSKYISLYGIENRDGIDEETYRRLELISFDNKEYERKFKEALMRAVRAKNVK